MSCMQFTVQLHPCALAHACLGEIDVFSCSIKKQDILSTSSEVRMRLSIYYKQIDCSFAGHFKAQISFKVNSKQQLNATHRIASLYPQPVELWSLHQLYSHRIV